MKKFFFLAVLAIMLASAAHKRNDIQNTGDDTPRTKVPDELVGTWEDGSLDFTLWESYREGYYSSRNSAATREAMVFEKNGNARFYRYQHAYPFYEELIDCTGTVTFSDDGTFTFYPTKGRKRHFDRRYSPNNKDRSLTKDELKSTKLAGKRGYVYNGSTTPPSVRITVPSSAPYNWYKKS
jgi:hypothetical protein